MASSSSLLRGSVADMSAPANVDGDEHRFSVTDAAFALAKCIVGAGCFVLPGAVKQAGLWLGGVSMLLLGAFTYYTITLLAWCAAEHARRQRQQLSATDWFRQQQQTFQRREQKQLQARLAYDELYDRGIADFADGASNVNASNIGFDGAFIEPVNFVTLGRDLIHPHLRHVIRVGILLTILGVCAIYLDLVGHLMVDVLDPDRSGRYAPVAWWTWTQRHVQWTLLPPIVALALLRNLKYLAFTSILGDVAVALCAAFVLVFGAQHHAIDTRLPAANFDKFPAFFASTVFLFAVHVVALPISQKMQQPSDFSRAAAVSFAVLTLSCALFAVFGYMLYGEQTKTLILDNLVGSSMGDAVKVLLCVDLVFTLPIVMTAPRELLEDMLLSRSGGGGGAAGDGSVEADGNTTTKQTGIRLLIVALIYALSMLVPDLGDLVNLVGGVASPLMGFILPPLFYIALRRSSSSAALPSPTSSSSSSSSAFSPSAYVGTDRASAESVSAFGAWSLIGHAAIVAFGVVAMCVSTYMTVDGILHPAPSA